MRVARSRDVPAIAALWRAAWASANPEATNVEPVEHWRARVLAEFGAPNECFVAWRLQVRLAFLVIDPAHCYLHQLFVAPGAQGAGLGSVLLHQIDRRFPEGWSLHVAETNTGARRFYERHGLLAGAASHHPVTSRRRVEYRRCMEGNAEQVVAARVRGL